MFEKAKRKKEKREAAYRDVFLYEKGDEVYTFDPLQTYVNIKETGFDVFGKELTGVMRGDPFQTKRFVDSIGKAFNITRFEDDKKGFTVFEMVELYVEFFMFVEFLKKKHTLLAVSAPSTEQLRQVLMNAKYGEQQDSEESATSSDSPKTSQEPPPQEELPPITESEPPSTE